MHIADWTLAHVQNQMEIDKETLLLPGRSNAIGSERNPHLEHGTIFGRAVCSDEHLIAAGPPWKGEQVHSTGSVSCLFICFNYRRSRCVDTDEVSIHFKVCLFYLDLLIFRHVA